MIGRLKAAGVLVTNEPIAEYRLPITVADTLWTAAIEPRVMELLPALLLKKPSLFEDPRGLPPDVAAVTAALRRNETPPPLRGIEPAALEKWVPLIGRPGKRPSRLKSFRMTPEDLLVLDEVCEQLGVTETDAVRQGLRALARTLRKE